MLITMKIQEELFFSFLSNLEDGASCKYSEAGLGVGSLEIPTAGLIV
jgi:hypothetical protein